MQKVFKRFSLYLQNVSMELTALGAWKIVVVIVLKARHVTLLAAHAKTVVAKDGLVQSASLVSKCYMYNIFSFDHFQFISNICHINIKHLQDGIILH